MPLTDLEIRNALPKDKPYRLPDGGNLYVLVMPDGAKYWRQDYRFGGKRPTLAHGVYPAVSLAEAREKRAAAKKLLRSGIDPGAQRKLDKIAAVESRKNTFRLVSEEWLEKRTREGVAAATSERSSG